MTTYSVNPTLTSTSGNTTTQNVATGDTINVTVAPGSSNATVVNANATNCSVSPSQDTSSPFTFTVNTFTSTSYSAYFYFVDGNTVTWDVTVSGTVSTSPTYSVTAPASINEGSSGTMNVSTTNVANGTTLYWTVEPAGDFGTSSGNFSISSNAGSFTVTPSADQTTEGAETGTIRIRTGSTSGTIVASDTFTINDTSTTPAGPGLGVTISNYTSNPTRYNNNGSVYTTATTTVVATSAYTHGLANCASNTIYWASYTSGASGDTATYSTISPIGRTYTTATSRTLAGMGGSSTSIALPSSYGGSLVYIWAVVVGTTITSSTTMTCTGASYYIEYPDDGISLSPSATTVSSSSTSDVTVNVTGDTSGTQYRLYTNDIPRWVSTYNGGGSASTDFTIAYSESELPTSGNTYTYFSQCRVTAGVDDGANSGGGALWINTGDSFTVTRSAAVPTFSVSANPTSVNEGQTVTFTLTTTNVPNGRTVGYTLTGITSNDLSSGSLTGSFSVSNNSAQVQVTLANDSTTEGPETMTLTCDSTDSSGASTGSPSTSVSISDTSTGSGGSGGGSGGLSGGSGTYGLKIFGANGSSVVFSPAHRTFQVIAGGKVTLAASGSTTVSNIANATDPTKVTISVMSDLAGSLQVAYTRNANSTVTFTNQSSGAGVTFRYHIYRIG